jgi:ankyrin repeat-rich membrane spanning protein
VSNLAPSKYFQACSTGKREVVSAFLRGGLDPNSRDKYKLTGLMWAGRKGRVEVADLLLRRGAEMEAVDATGRTALFHAVTYQRYDFVDFLAARGANVNPVDMHGWTPLDFSRSSRHMKMVKLLERLRGVGRFTAANTGATISAHQPARQ